MMKTKFGRGLLNLTLLDQDHDPSQHPQKKGVVMSGVVIKGMVLLNSRLNISIVIIMLSINNGEAGPSRSRKTEWKHQFFDDRMTNRRRREREGEGRLTK